MKLTCTSDCRPGMNVIGYQQVINKLHFCKALGQQGINFNFQAISLYIDSQSTSHIISAFENATKCYEHVYKFIQHDLAGIFQVSSQLKNMKKYFTTLNCVVVVTILYKI